LIFDLSFLSCPYRLTRALGSTWVKLSRLVVVEMMMGLNYGASCGSGTGERSFGEKMDGKEVERSVWMMSG
jgi:hypothetical protein